MTIAAMMGSVALAVSGCDVQHKSVCFEPEPPYVLAEGDYDKFTNLHVREDCVKPRAAAPVVVHHAPPSDNPKQPILPEPPKPPKPKFPQVQQPLTPDSSVRPERGDRRSRDDG